MIIKHKGKEFKSVREMLWESRLRWKSARELLRESRLRRGLIINPQEAIHV